MFRLVIFHEQSAATAADTSLAFAPVAGLEDPHVTVKGDKIFVPADTPGLVAFLGWGGSITATETAVISNMRLEAPSLKPDLDIAAFQVPGAAEADAEVPASPTPLNVYAGRNMALVPGEAVQLMTRESVAGDDRQSTGLLFLGDGDYGLGAYANLRMQTLRFDASISCTAFTWTNGAITFEQALPAGKYAIVGMRVISATGIAGRLVFPSGPGARPGCVAYDSLEDIENQLFRSGNLGVWGIFDHASPPTLDMFCVSTDSSQEGFLDVIQIG